MQVESSIFKAYDIRGVVPTTVTEKTAEGIGKAFGTIARLEGETSVSVGRSLILAYITGCVNDGSSPSLWPSRR